MILLINNYNNNDINNDNNTKNDNNKYCLNEKIININCY